MSRVLVWDLPTRIIHWLMAVGFLSAATIALVLGDESPLFPFHAIIGLALALLVLLRIVWGLLGTRYARFGSLGFGPVALAGYMKGAVLGGAKRYMGHNPGSAYAAIAMLVILAGLAATGFMLGRGNEGVKEVHEALAYAMLAVVGLHLLGIAAHTLRHRENIASSMVHGRKSGDDAAGIASAHPAAGFAVVALTVAWVSLIYANFDSSAQTTRLPLLGQLQLGEGEHEGGEGGDHEEHEEEHDD